MGREKPVSSHRAMYMAKVGNLAGPCPWHDAPTPALSRAGVDSHREGQCEWPQRLMALTQASTHSLLLSPALFSHARKGPLSFQLSQGSFSGAGKGGKPD